jgi:uncharacterized protein YhaN
MKTKLFGIALMALGLVGLGWTAIIVLLAKGMFALIYGVIPLAAGWIIFTYASKESPNQATENAASMGEIKSGVARLRSFLKGLL